MNCNNDTCTWVPDTTTLRVKRVDSASMPLKQAYDSSACTDMSIVRLIKIENGVAYFGTGISVGIPSGFYVELHARSSLHKHGWVLANSVGIIDEDYRGELIVALQPVSTVASKLMMDMSTVSEGGGIISPSIDSVVERVVSNTTLPLYACQFSLHRKESFSMVEVDELEPTSRGDGSFGSSN